jgi:hypothetical protein
MIPIRAKIGHRAGVQTGEIRNVFTSAFCGNRCMELLAIVGLLWVMACAARATNLKKEGIAFRKGLLAVSRG